MAPPPPYPPLGFSSPTFFLFFFFSCAVKGITGTIFIHTRSEFGQRAICRREGRNGKDVWGEFKQVITAASRTYPLHTSQSLKPDLRGGRLIEDLSSGSGTYFMEEQSYYTAVFSLL